MMDKKEQALFEFIAVMKDMYSARERMERFNKEYKPILDSLPPEEIQTMSKRILTPDMALMFMYIMSNKTI